MCSHKWNIQNISDGFFILSPGSCPRGGIWGYLGAKIKFRPAVCPLCYLLLNHLTKFNQILVCELLTWMGRTTSIFLAPPPGALGRGRKVKYHLISITKSMSKLGLCSHKWKVQNILDRFLFCRLGHALGWDLGVLRGQNQILAVCPLCYFLLNHWTKFNQI